jgi:hypothetical protein
VTAVPKATNSGEVSVLAFFQIEANVTYSGDGGAQSPTTGDSCQFTAPGTIYTP